MSNGDVDDGVHIEEYILVVYGYLTLIVTMFITVLFVKKLREHRSKEKEQESNDIDMVGVIQMDEMNRRKTITRASTVAIFIYLFASITWAFACTKWILVDRRHGILANRLLFNVGTVLYSFNIFGTVFYVLAQRLNLLLKSKCLNITSYALPLVGWCFCMLLRFVIEYAMPKIVVFYGKVNALVGIVVMMIYFVIALLYMRQINTIMRIRAEANMSLKYIEMTQDALATTDKEETNKQDQVIVSFSTVQDTIRCALLVMICSVSNIMVPIAAFIGRFYMKHPTHHPTIGLYAFFTDTVINTLCLFLLFGFSERYYFGLCGSCHQCVLNLCVNGVSKGFRKKNKKVTHQQCVSLIIDELEE